MFRNNEKIIKFYRYATIYGFRRAVIKAIGRSKIVIPLAPLLAPLKYKKKPLVAVIGCGQFTFSTIAFYLTRKFGRCIHVCLDICPEAATFFSRCYGVTHCYTTLTEDIDLQGIKTVYIASNHASHTDYAVYFLSRGFNVYVEKPISISREQLNRLKAEVDKNDAQLFVGYNRPFSAAIIELKTLLKPMPITLSCLIQGHLIPEDHWYRKPGEGTRICGNLGHWIDLAVHLISFKRQPGFFAITVAYADESNPDDNLTIVLTTEQQDLITLTLTAREEPFEGINETISLQQDGLFVKIDDFRQATFQQGSRKYIRKYNPKDVGHRRAIMQPFCSEVRNKEEIFLSTELMLHVMDMVNTRAKNSKFYINSPISKFIKHNEIYEV